MNDVLDLEPIKERLAATTPGEWYWSDEVGDIPYTDAQWLPSNEPVIPDHDGTLGVKGLYRSVPEHTNDYISEPILLATYEDIPADPSDPTEIDWTKWCGLIHASNLADLEFMATAKNDVAALVAEVERLRRLLRMG